jgi:hypothetical protein
MGRGACLVSSICRLRMISSDANLDRLPDVWGDESYIKTSGWDACQGLQKECQFEDIKRVAGGISQGWYAYTNSIPH